MRRPDRPIVSLLTAVAALSAAKAVADDGGWQPLFRRHAAEYRVSVAGGPTAATLSDEPILKWSQPVRGGDDGAVFVWTGDGRPVALGTFFIWPAPDGRMGVSHELVSLSTEPLVAERRERRWTPPADAVSWRPVPDAPAPGATAAARDLQLRGIARRFAARSVDRDGKPWELRLLSKPIHRYESDAPVGQAVCGALFGFAQGTDVELVLRFERRSSPTAARWEFAAARLSDLRLTLDYAGAEVWSAPAAAVDQPDGAYFLGTVEYRDEPPGPVEELAGSAEDAAQEPPPAASTPQDP